MNNRLIKDIPKIEIPNDEIILELKMLQSGKLYLQAPTLHPSVVCKMLLNVVVDLMFGTFQSQEQSSLITPISHIDQ